MSWDGVLAFSNARIDDSANSWHGKLLVQSLVPISTLNTSSTKEFPDVRGRATLPPIHGSACFSTAGATASIMSG
jgi:hypothetical protein